MREPKSRSRSKLKPIETDAATDCVDFRAHLAPSPIDRLVRTPDAETCAAHLAKRKPASPDFWFSVNVRDLNNSADEPKVNRPKRAVEVCANWRF